MENKTTTELLDLLTKLSDEKGDFKEGGRYRKIMNELEERDPFIQILGEDWETALPAVWEKIEELKAEVKKLKRHKHDPSTGDLLIRI